MSSIALTQSNMPAGGGPFKLPRLTLGVFLVEQQTHRVALGSDQRSHLPLNKHEGWILPQGCEGICEFDAPLDVMMIEFDEQLLDEVGLTSPGDFAPYFGPLDPITLQLALGMEDVLAAGTLYRETMSRAFAAHLPKSAGVDPALAPDIEDRRLKRATDHIRDNIATDISLEDLAGIAAMSPYHFARAFKTATGLSPLQYVIGARVELAKVLLKTTKLTIADIALRAGYADPGRFSQHFRQRVGVTPGVFRAG